MNWKSLRLWNDGDITWHALYGYHHADLTMGPVSKFRTRSIQKTETDKLLAWAKMHSLEIIDDRTSAQAA